MSEYTAITIGVSSVMLMLLYLTFHLSDKYDALKIFFISIFFIWGNIVLNVAKQVSMAASAPAELQNSIEYGMYVWIVITFIALMYILVYVIPDTYKAMKEASTVRRESKKEIYDND